MASLAQAQTGHGEEAREITEPRLFFPNGIELLYFKLGFGNEINITVAIAGEKAKYPGASAAAVSVEPADASTTQSVADGG